MSQFGIRAKLCAGKSVLTHPFKLDALAILCVGSGEVMVILTLLLGTRDETASGHG
jgi:hypothetical protein